MTKHTTVFASLLRHLSTSEFQSAISGFKADSRTRTLTTWNMFKVMLYGQLCGCFSVREIITSMNANRNRLYHAGLKSVKRSTFCEAMGKRNSDIFQSVFHLLSEKAQCISGRAKKKFTNPYRPAWTKNKREVSPTFKEGNLSRYGIQPHLRIFNQ